MRNNYLSCIRVIADGRNNGKHAVIYKLSYYKSELCYKDKLARLCHAHISARDHNF